MMEVLTMMLVTVMTTGIVYGFMRTANQVWSKTSAEQSAKDVLYLAANRIAPFVRTALKVDPSSTSTVLVLDQPAVDTVHGGYTLPLTLGNVDTFYLSNTTGAAGTNGTILWHALNGVPDTAWALNSGSPPLDLGENSIQFTYSPSTDPETVQLSIDTLQNVPRSAAVKGNLTTTLVLRNHQIARGGQ